MDPLGIEYTPWNQQLAPYKARPRGPQNEIHLNQPLIFREGSDLVVFSYVKCFRFSILEGLESSFESCVFIAIYSSMVLLFSASFLCLP